MANFSSNKPQLPFHEVWQDADEFRAEQQPGSTMSIREDGAYKTGRIRYVVGVHSAKGPHTPPRAEHLAMKVGPANQRLVIMREARKPFPQADKVTNMAAFTSLD